MEIEEHKKNDNSDPSENDNNNQSPPPNQDPPPADFKPQIDTSQIDNAKNIQEARTKAKEQINKLFSESKVKSSELDKKL